MSTPNVSSSFVRQITTDGQGHITSVRIETALPITLVGDADSTGPDVYPLVDVDHDLEVYADTVTVRGKITLPGRSVLIVARVLHGESAKDSEGNEVAPTIDVSGRPGEAPPRPLAKGESPASGKLKKVRGATGDSGQIYVWQPFPDTSARDKPGGNGEGRGTNQDAFDGEPGNEGAPGQPGGTITIVCDQVTGAFGFNLYANGGRGGAGQDGQPGADGGDGGPGADAVDRGLQGWGGPTPNGWGGQGGIGGGGGTGGPGGKGGQIRTCVHTFAKAGTVSYHPGEGGAGGTGGQPGKSGHGGRGGRGTGVRPFLDHNQEAVHRWQYGFPSGKAPGVLWAGNSGGRGPKGGDGVANFQQVDKESFVAVARPTQLQQMLDALRMEWLNRPPAGKPQSGDDLEERFAWLYSVLAAMRDSSAYKESPNPIVSGLHQEAFAAYANYKDGRDYFGNFPNFVPSFTFQTYVNGATRAANALGAIEEWAGKVYDAASNEESAVDAALNAHQQAKDAVDYLNASLKRVQEALKDIEGRLETAEAARKVQADSLEKAMDKFKEEAKNAFGLEPKEVLNALSTMAFSLGEARGMALQGVSQAGVLGIDASESIIDDAGNMVNKQFVVKKIEKLESENLKAELEKRSSGFRDPSASYTLLVELSQIREMCSKFVSAAKEASDATRALDRYIASIEHRNSIVSEYNTQVRNGLDLKGAITRASQQVKTTGEELEKGTDPGIAAILAYVRGLHERAKAECLRELSLASRARSFFLLKPSTVSSMIGNLEDVNKAIIVGAVNKLDKEVTDAISAAPHITQPFPANPEANQDTNGTRWYPSGVLVVLTPTTHPPLFRSLSRLGSMEFVIEPSHPGLNEPSTIDTPTAAAKPLESTSTAGNEDTNPFAGMANVRLTRVRVFLEGIQTTNQQPVVLLIHKGSERLYSPEGKAFPPDAGYATHAPIASAFQYDIRHYQFDQERGFAADAMDLSGIKFDGNFGAMTNEVDVTYIPIGPFGRWELSINENENPGLSLDSVTRILIDFHGTSQHFEKVN